MHGPKSLELMMELADLALYGGILASKAIAKRTFAIHGGKPKAYKSLLQRLERKGVIAIEKRNSPDPRDWLPHLTDSGAATIMDQNPRDAWEAKWDGTWRLLTFDLPSHDSQSRSQLRRWLKTIKFGKIQGSVWITHRPMTEIELSFGKLEIPPKHIVCMSGKFWDRTQNDHYVEQAWNLDKVQDAYADYIDFLKLNPPTELKSDERLIWLRRERSIWTAATQIDPMLPQALWPSSRGNNPRALEAASRREEAKKRVLEAQLAAD